MRNILTSNTGRNAAFASSMVQPSSHIPSEISASSSEMDTKPASDENAATAVPTILGSRAQPRGFRKSLFRS